MKFRNIIITAALFCGCYAVKGQQINYKFPEKINVAQNGLPADLSAEASAKAEVLTEAGNVGIGAVAPVAPLQIHSNKEVHLQPVTLMPG